MIDPGCGVCWSEMVHPVNFSGSDVQVAESISAIRNLVGDAAAGRSFPHGLTAESISHPALEGEHGQIL